MLLRRKNSLTKRIGSGLRSVLQAKSVLPTAAARKLIVDIWRPVRSRTSLGQVFTLAGAVALLLGSVPLMTLKASAKSAPLPFIDLHIDLPYQHVYKGKDWDHGSGQMVHSKAALGGLGGIVLPLFIPKDVSKTGPTLAEMEKSYSMVRSALAIDPLFAFPGGDQSRSVRTWLSFEGSAPLAGQKDVRVWARRGVAIAGLIHSQDNELGSSATGNGKDQGLSLAGKELAESFVDAGILIDVSHASKKSYWDLSKISKLHGMPLIATHSNASALAKHLRNLEDDQIVDLCASGGIIGVNFYYRFLKAEGPAQLSDVVEQIMYIAKKGSIDCVALGSDFEGGIRPAEGLEDISKLPALSDALLKVGMPMAEVQKVFWGNAWRVLSLSRARASAVESRKPGQL